MTIYEFEEDSEMNGIRVLEASSYYYVETELDIDEDAAPPPPPIPPVSSLVPRLSSDKQRHLSSSLRRQELCYIISNPKSTKIDFLSFLPPEISVYILSLLHPRHLCRVVQVSKTWRWLAQYGQLKTKRWRYVQRKREKYLRAKENMTGFRQPTTPQSFTRGSLHLDCTPSSPLTSIENSQHRFSRQQRFQSPYLREGDTPGHLPRHNDTSLRQSSRHYHHHHHHHHHLHQHQGQSPQFRTPDNGMYRRLEDSDPIYMVRRCLFPSQTPPPVNQVRHTPLEEDLHLDYPHIPPASVTLSTKKSASKRRLKRL